MRIRDWWNQASESDQDAVLYHVRLDRDLAGVPWPFLPEEVQAVLIRRVRIKAPSGQGADGIVDNIRPSDNDRHV